MDYKKFLIRVTLDQELCGHMGVGDTMEDHAENVKKLARVDVLAFNTKFEGKAQFLFANLEHADGAGWHIHGMIKAKVTRPTLGKYVAEVFKVKGNAGYSVKEAIEDKIEDYLCYCGKGYLGVKGSPVVNVFDDEPRLWDLFHGRFHSKAEEIAARKAGKKGPEEWYEALAQELVDGGLKTKEDVLRRVVQYYVKESKKGFDKFAVCRTFWRVYSLVCEADAQELIFASVAELVFKV